MEEYVESWVFDIKMGEANGPSTNMAFEERVRYGLNAVREIVGKVWPYVLAGIAVGAFIHGYVPDGLLASFMGKGAWWSVPGSSTDRHPHLLQCRRDHTSSPGFDGKRGSTGHRIGFHDGCSGPASTNSSLNSASFTITPNFFARLTAFLMLYSAPSFHQREKVVIRITAAFSHSI